MSKVNLTPEYWHEACDRTYCIQEMVDQLLSQHPAIKQTPELKKMVANVQEILGEVYQITGSKM